MFFYKLTNDYEDAPTAHARIQTYFLSKQNIPCLTTGNRVLSTTNETIFFQNPPDLKTRSPIKFIKKPKYYY